MTRKLSGNIYTTLKIPEKLIELIDIEKQNRGFTSRTDYVKYVVRKDVEANKINGLEKK